MSPVSNRRFLTSGLVAGVSILALAAPAMASETLFASDAAIGQAASSGQRVTQQGGLTQVRLDNGGTASFVDGASFQLRADGSVDLFSGSVTVAGGDGGAVVVHLANQGDGRVQGAGSAASFSVDLREGKTPGLRGHVLNGTMLISFGAGNPQIFRTGEMWRSNGGSAHLAVANGAARVPDADARASGSAEEPLVEAMGRGTADNGGGGGGLVAAADNGVPVVLGDALAAAGASGDIVAAARRVQAASANPSLETYPSGDLALLVGYAGRLNGAYGGTPFNGAAADIIRTYLQFLADGGSQANFLTSYAGFTLQFLDLMRAGALPSAFRGASLAQINSFISYRGRTVGFGGFTAQNKVLIENYLAFIVGGGTADQFLVRYTDLTASFFTFLRGGGTPAAFAGASQTTITAYLTFLRDAGLLGQLTAQNQSLLTAYLQSLSANGAGLAFADQYRVSLNSYYLFLQQGRLPSTYTAADLAALRTYLESLKSTGLFDVTLGSQASFFNGYLVYLQGGGTVDGYGQLPANIFASYTLQLNAYYAFLRDGGLPSAYTVLTQAQISAYLTALQNAGATTRYLGDLSTFWTNYFAWYSANNNPDLFAGLPAVNYPAFASALNTYYAYLAGGGLPSGYTALTQAQLQQYSNALIAAGRSSELLGTNASFLTAYFAFINGGGVANNYSGLPIYATYTSALNAYYIYLQGGGVPSGYSLLNAAQIQAYLHALVSAGVFNTLVTGDAQTFLTSYYAYISGGGTPNGYSMLPVYTSYTTALNAYYIYLQTGGLPSGYTLLTTAQLQAYLQALIDAGVFNTLFTGSTASFFQGYYTFVSGGGTANNYSGLATINGSSVTSSATGTLTTYTGGFVTGTGAKVFAVNAGNSQPATGTPTLTSGGALIDAGSIGNVNAQVVDIAGDSSAIIGRFTNGTAKFVNSTTAFGANGGLPYVVLAPIVGSLPTTGTIDYAVLAATHPVFASGSAAPGSFGGSMTIGFSGSSLSYKTTGTIIMPETGGSKTYTYASAGYSAGTLVALGAPSAGGLIFNANLTGTGAACSGTGCNLIFYGNFGGSTPQNHLGLTYQTYPGTTGTERIQGAVIFVPTAGSGGGSVTASAPTGTGLRFATSGASTQQFGAFTDIVAQSDGKLVSFGTVTRGTATDHENGGIAGIVGWSRWSGGTTSGSDVKVLPVNGGGGKIWAVAATAVPTSGSATYALAGSTAVTANDGGFAPGTVRAASLAVNFATRLVGFDSTIGINGIDYTLASTGGLAAPSMALDSLNVFRAQGSLVVGGNGCRTCYGDLTGFLAGPGASHAGLSFSFINSQNNAVLVNGVIAFGSQVIASSATAAPTGAGMIMRSVGKSFNPGTTVRFAEGSFNTVTSTVSVTAGNDGQLQVGNISGDTVTRATASNVDYGTAGGAIGWTRWAGGTATYGTGANNTMEMPANGGIAFIWGAPVTNMPTTGTATYAIAGSTRPMLQSGAAAPGTLNSASLSVNFATKNADFAANLTVNSTTYAISNNAPMPIATDGTFTNFNNTSHIQGFLAGAGAGYAGVTYNIFGPGVSGVIAFTKGP